MRWSIMQRIIMWRPVMRWSTGRAIVRWSIMWGLIVWRLRRIATALMVSRKLLMVITIPVAKSGQPDVFEARPGEGPRVGPEFLEGIYVVVSRPAIAVMAFEQVAAAMVVSVGAQERVFSVIVAIRPVPGIPVIKWAVTRFVFWLSVVMTIRRKPGSRCSNRSSWASLGLKESPLASALAVNPASAVMLSARTRKAPFMDEM